MSKQVDKHLALGRTHIGHQVTFRDWQVVKQGVLLRVTDHPKLSITFWIKVEGEVLPHAAVLECMITCECDEAKKQKETLR